MYSFLLNVNNLSIDIYLLHLSKLYCTIGHNIIYLLKRQGNCIIGIVALPQVRLMQSGITCFHLHSFLYQL